MARRIEYPMATMLILKAMSVCALYCETGGRATDQKMLKYPRRPILSERSALDL